MARLRVAGEADEPLSITESLDAGRREVLVALRLQLAQKLDAGDIASNAIASAYTKLQSLDDDIRSLDAAEQEEERRATPSASRRSFNIKAV